MRIVHAVHIFGTSQRHKNAQLSWSRLYMQGVVPAHTSGYPRDAYNTIGDSRHLPYLRDIIWNGWLLAKDDGVVIWTNDDIGLGAGIVDWVNGFVVQRGAMSMRRDESGHVGRDLFAFTSKWLKDNLDSIPDFIQGAPCFDLVLAALIRKQHGIESTLGNLTQDIEPSESPHRLALHAPHPSEWAGAMEYKHPANLWNKKLAVEWCNKNMPSLQL